ncbi:MAG TPA: pitrilysin family protein [bacterium]|nr:pitrilysin family protein [bacterium]
MASSASALPLYRDSLPNGLIVLTYEDHRLPTASFSLVCRSGAACDPEGKAGTAALTAEMLTRGTATMSGDSISSLVEFLGGDFHGSASGDFMDLSTQVLSKDVPTALDLLADAALHPAFDPKELKLALDRFLSGAQRIKDSPNQQVDQEFIKLVYQGLPYGHPNYGDTLSIPLIKREDLLAFYNTYVKPNNCFIIAVGDVKRADLVAAVTQRLGSWTPAQVPQPKSLTATYPDRMKVKVITRSDMNQTYVEFGHPGITATDPDMLATRLMSYILGGSAMNSRLGNTVREKGGLAYDVRCWFDRNTLPGAYHATVQTANPKEAIAKMLRVIQVMHDSGAAAAELEKAQNYYTGSFPLTYSSTGGKRSQVLTMELFHYGMDWLDKFPDRVRAVTLDQVNKAASDHIKPGKYWMVILGPVTKEDLGLTDVEWIQ